MKLGIAIDYGNRQINLPLEYIQKAEELGYDSVWSAEAYGSDAITPLAYIAAHTRHIRLGTGIAQLAGRTAANLAMTAATLDQLAGPPNPESTAKSRVILGIGVSGPQIVEGWYGEPWGKPAERIRDYITIIKKIFKRQAPVTHNGKEIQLPYTGEGSTGQGKPLKSILHPNPDIPVWLGCGGNLSTQIMAELADGWLPMGMPPENWGDYKPILEKGLAKSGRTMNDLEIQGGCHIEVTEDLEGAWAKRKPALGFLVGGYGSQSHNFHKEAMKRRGYEAEAEKVQTLFLEGKRDEAYEAIPDSYIDEMGLYGPIERIKERFNRYKNIYTGLTIHPSPENEILDEIEILELMADIASDIAK